MKTNSSYLVFFMALVASLVSCSKDNNDDNESVNKDLSLTPSSISLYYEDTYQLTGNNVTKWETQDEFVAMVDSKGLVTGGHVGTTQIIASNGGQSATCQVTITPKYFLYDTPILEWGASMSTIQSKENHKKSSGTSTMLAYDYSKNNISCALTYNFTNGKLSRIDIYMALSQYLTVSKYLMERYCPLSVEGQGDLVMYADGYTKGKMTTVIGLQTTKVSGTQLTYISYIPSN